MKANEWVLLHDILSKSPYGRHADRGMGCCLLPFLQGKGWQCPDRVSQITFIASLIAFGLAGLTVIASLTGLTLGKNPEIIHEVIDGTPVTHA